MCNMDREVKLESEQDNGKYSDARRGAKVASGLALGAMFGYAVSVGAESLVPMADNAKPVYEYFAVTASALLGAFVTREATL